MITSPTPKWAVHHSDGSWSCFDCGRASRSIDGVRGHRRSCKGISGVAQKVEEIRQSVLGNANLSRLSGSQQTAEPAAQAAPSQPMYAPSPYRALPGRLSQPAEPSQIVGYDDPSMEIAALKQTVTRLEQAILVMSEKSGNDIRHLSSARLAQQADEERYSWVPWALGFGVAAVIVYGLVSASGDTSEPSQPGEAMGGRFTPRRAPTNGNGIGEVLDMGSKGLAFFSKARNAFKI